MQKVIVSRHPAAVSFLRAECPEFADAEVLASATAEDVRGKVVGGNLPMHLAAEAAEVVAVEFNGPPPRGKELSLQDMRAAGARVRRYQIVPVPQAEKSPEVEVDAQLQAVLQAIRNAKRRLARAQHNLIAQGRQVHRP